LCPTVTGTVTWTQLLVLVHVGLRGVVLVFAVLSCRAAVAQSYLTVSGQCTWYQNDRLVAPDGTVNVCLIDESREVGVVLPPTAA